MSAGAQALTVINGGINRLRTKGGADKNSLYDLVNGYVTNAGTIKVRPGTFRNANIAAYSGAGTTFGLVAYQSQLHVFASSIVSVPPGYALHVLNHPAGSQVNSIQPTYTGNLTTSNSSNLGFGSFPFNGTWESAGVGYIGNDTTGGGSLFAAQGTLAETDSGTFLTTNILALGTTNYSGQNYVIMVTPSTLLVPSAPFTLSLTLSGGSKHTYSSASATYYPGNPPPFGIGNPSDYHVWMWATSNADFVNAEITAVSLTWPTTTVQIVPLKEIHYAAPFLGGLYVVAEFANNDPTQESIFHYWIQSSTSGSNVNTWEANTHYDIGDVVIPTIPNGLTYLATRKFSPAPVWTASTAEALNNVIEPTVYNGYQYKVTAVLGANPTTGATEPTWPTPDGATVQENSNQANDSSFQIANAADATPSPSIPSAYTGTIAGGFLRNTPTGFAG